MSLSRPSTGPMLSMIACRLETKVVAIARREMARYRPAPPKVSASSRKSMRRSLQGAGRPRGHQARAALPPRGHHAMPQLHTGITARLAGQPLSQSHQQLHGQRLDEEPDSF